MEARRIARDEGRTLIHAFDQATVVAGQGTVGLEIARQDPEVRLVVVPLGGGGGVASLHDGRDEGRHVPDHVVGRDD